MVSVFAQFVKIKISKIIVKL